MLLLKKFVVGVQAKLYNGRTDQKSRVFDTPTRERANPCNMLNFDMRARKTGHFQFSLKRVNFRGMFYSSYIQVERYRIGFEHLSASMDSCYFFPIRTQRVLCATTMNFYLRRSCCISIGMSITLKMLR